ncbi:MAG TPA: DNA recombination protein RmuC [Streptosporangiaceae bacterium]|nr:DNA recombination protein RmuC [Streptosporangiaceae bacterium]
MSAIMLIAGLILGIIIGAVIGYLYARGRVASATADLASQASAAAERARAAEQRAEMIERTERERVALIDGQLAQRFQSLSAEALDASTARFLEIAEGRLRAENVKAAGELEQRRAAVEHLVGPLRETLTRLEAQLRESESARRASHAALAEQVNLTRHSAEQLRDQTQALVTALRRPEARGRWGELQLRRVVELAGMSAHCDFEEQVSLAGDSGPQRPDMIVRLAGGKNIVVDSKVSLAAYLEAVEAADESVRAARLDAHARHLREHVDRLAAKAYWTALSPSPEFVVLFIPGEAFLAPALERDPGLLEHAMARKVHIATPTTLVTMLRTAQYTWQQEALSENARAVFDLGRELHARIAGLGRNIDRLGRALTNAVTAYNQTVGSLESRVLVSARRLSQLGVVDAELPPPALVEETARSLSAPELVAAGAEDTGAGAAPGTSVAQPGTPIAQPGTSLAVPGEERSGESPEIGSRDELLKASQWT